MIPSLQKQQQPVRTLETANIKIDGPINGQLRLQTEGAIANLMRQGLKHLNLIINTPGGMTNEGIALFNFLKGIKDVTIHTYNIGQVDSIGVVIFCAGSKRFATPNSRFLIHRVQTNFNAPASLDENLLVQSLNNLKMDQGQILDIIATACGKKKSDVEPDIVNSIHLTSTDAFAYGLVHEVEVKLPMENLISIHPPIHPQQQQIILPQQQMFQ